MPLTAAAGPARRLLAAANRPVEADSIAVFRIGYGLVVAYSSVRFLAKGWVDTLYLEPAHHLTYPGFDWVRPWPAPWMHLHLVALAVAGLCIAAGYRHRLAVMVFVVGFSYVELIDAALYLNHYWFVTLAGLLLVVLPVHHRWSLDAHLGRVQSSATVPVAVVWALRAQLAVVYLFAGLAKLNHDWLVRGLPLGMWLPARPDLPVVGWLGALPHAGLAASWAGAVFDCTIVGWLLWRRSRPFAYLAVVAFHTVTGLLFPIGVFPLLMITGTLVFFPPDWPTRLLARLSPVRQIRLPTRQIVWRIGNLIRRGSPRRLVPARPNAGAGRLGVLAVLAVVQLALPLRHFAYPGNVRWTEEGYELSWRVMLTEKAGHVVFRVTDPASDTTWEVGPELVLTDWQAAQAAIRPQLLHTTAHLVADRYRAAGIDGVEVRADASVSMNGDKARPLVDPTVDLAALPRSYTPAEWIER